MNLLKTTLATVLVSALSLPAVAEVDPNVAQSRMVVKDFFKTLKGELVGAMKAGGPVNAINVCNKRAMMIAVDKSMTHNIRVARTSLKLRNPVNAPDEWEEKVLNDFEKRKAAGESPKKIEYSEVVTNKFGKQQFRYMKAIPMGKPCMACHAEKIKPEVEARLKELYPADKARGFKPGDIRGAFTITKDL
ncbi:MAG: DUF3365 domain-containing protein [Gammaproteobacteria bacterium]|nr:DUF3365 domain-containing protein [Gammaproteobacteria bacterium]